MKIDPKELEGRKRTRYLHERINEYSELARHEKCEKITEIESYNVPELGDDDLAEWHEDKGDELSEFADFY